MPAITISNLSYHLDNGTTLFKNLSVTLTEHRTGLVGCNGAGKSVLASLLTKEILPTQGEVMISGEVVIYRQTPSNLLHSSTTIAEFLGVNRLLEALDHIEQGSCELKWFEVVGERWQLRSELEKQLIALGLPNDSHTPCALLSGGQLARLQLWQLFQSNADLLILDEPSNHLDNLAKQWLIEEMKAFPNQILLISHDRVLLREMQHIWELSHCGRQHYRKLKHYGGSYDEYIVQKNFESQALEKQLNHIEKEQKLLKRQVQINKEKAERRAVKGKQIRKQGGMPKILLNTMRSNATASASSRSKNEANRSQLLCDKAQSLQTKQETLRPQKIALQSGESTKGTILNLQQVVLPFGHEIPINFTLSANDKVHIKGNNGSGKSTLLKVLLGEFKAKSGEVRMNVFAPCESLKNVYLDQHFSLLESTMSMLGNMQHFCQGLAESDARTLLAGIGFRRDDVHRKVTQLSGGEKMKLAMLVVSHQPHQPLLLLDEPDNHLDLASKTLLANALCDYQGAFILVSHDEEFVFESGVNRVLSFS